MPVVKAQVCDAAGQACGNLANRQRLHDYRPVENGRICDRLAASRPASAAQVVRASCMPCSPVPAFALPVLITRARMPSGCERCSRATITGAAQKRFLVTTPATRVPSLSLHYQQSLRFSRLIPASVTPKETPATGNSCAATGVVRFTGITVSLVASVNAIDIIAQFRRLCIHAAHNTMHIAHHTSHYLYTIIGWVLISVSNFALGMLSSLIISDRAKGCADMGGCTPRKRNDASKSRV